MENEIDDINDRINEYFSNITDEQLKLDLQKAGYEFYKNVDIKIFEN